MASPCIPDPRWRRIAGALLLHCAGAALAQPAPAEPGRPVETFARQLLAAINAERARLGLGLLAPASDLSVIATAHSRDMVASGRLSHDGFAARFAGADRNACVENLASGPIGPEALVDAWSASPAHRRNLVSPRLRQAGIAKVDGYVTFFACE